MRLNFFVKFKEMIKHYNIIRRYWIFCGWPFWRQ